MNFEVVDIPPHPLDKYIKTERLPNTFCPGCGIGTAFSCLLNALKICKLPKEDIVIVSGIGCTARASGYFRGDSFHSVHGRAIPFAIGVETTNPKLEAIVFSGDGDLFSIGGNHFIHAARRNADITVICVDNSIYGMTGGQIAPTTPPGAMTTTTPKGATLKNFNLAHLAKGAGAIYVSRYPVTRQRQLTRSIADAINKDGFSFVEIITPCPTVFGGKNKLSIQEMYRQLKENSSPITNEQREHPERAPLVFEAGKGFQDIPYGVFVDI
ncbi:MAG: thiamine pyrophosphate-dependent enzyme [Candidatus Hodarchaeales archaeon]|jgi:2-oxoglutarate ferredoxin oxidoreductase subunit beta